MAASTRKPHTLWLVCALLLFGLGMAVGHRTLMSTIRTEIGGIALDQGVLMLQESPWEPNPYLDRALRNYLAATSWDPGNAHAWRKLGEVYLTLGQNEPARDALARATDLEPDRHLYQVLLGDAYDGLGASREALEAWSAGRGGALRRDGILVNGAKIALAHIETGDPLSAMPVLVDTVLRLDPDNLFALSTVVTAYDSAMDGDHPLADPYRDAALYPTRRTLQPGTDPRLAEYQARGAMQLYRSGYWTDEMVGGVARYWATLGYPASVHLAQALRESEPEREEWLLLQAEALVRTDRAGEAVALLQSVGDNPTLAARRWAAIARLAVARVSGETADWRTAVEALRGYAQAAPTDLWPLAALAEAYEQLGDVAAATSAAEGWRSRTEGIDISGAAEALGVPSGAVTLGANLIPNGGFEAWENGLPAGWIWSNMATGDPWNRGLYEGGAEELVGLAGTSLRVQGVWQQEDPKKDAARAGYWLYDASIGDLWPVALEAGRRYVLSVDYLVEEFGRPSPTMWLSYMESPCWKNDRRLEATAGEWRHAAWVCQPVSVDDDPLRPLIRLFGTGIAMYDNLQIREVILAADGKKEQ